jgi:hypothetical protein
MISTTAPAITAQQTGVVGTLSHPSFSFFPFSSAGIIRDKGDV